MRQTIAIVWDVQLRHQGGGREGFTKEVAFELYLEPKSGGLHKALRQARHLGRRSLECKDMEETWLVLDLYSFAVTGTEDA